MMPGKLHIVATPIGNLEDVTLRALRVLAEVDIIAAEDTRVTRKLLSRYDVHTPLISYHSRSKPARLDEVTKLLAEGKNVALVSDAGTPGISDPGYELIRACIAEGFAVEAIPGPTALVTALVLSGLPTARFVFDGFPPRRQGERARHFRELRREARTLCLYEAPTRLLATLNSIRGEMGDRRIAVVREVTKLFEEVYRGSVTGAIEHFSAREVRGEIVIVIEGASADDSAREEQASVDLGTRLRELLVSGMSERDAVRQCSVELGIPRRQVYSAALAIKRSPGI